MASIKINNLQPTGLSLFSDSETFLDELNSHELNTVNGGAVPTVLTPTILVNPLSPAVAAGVVVGVAVYYLVS
jgi:hypothetical protein